VPALAAVMIALAAVVAAPGAAAALSPADVKADGVPLAGTTQADGEFLLSVEAPDGVVVRFKLDGVYLGQDDAAPYTWPVSTSRGDHTVNVRWGDDDALQQLDVQFAVSLAVPPVAIPRGTPVPTSVSVATASELVAALKAVQPGQTITLQDGTYTGQFVANVHGSSSQRITLTGSRNAVLTTGSTSTGYGLHVTANYWTISGLSVTGSAKGIMVDAANHTIIDGVDVGNIGEEGVHFRKNSMESTLQNSIIHDTGLTRAEYGEGVYVGSAKSNWTNSSTPDRSNSAQILNNTISNTTAEGIDVKEGTVGGVITGNTFTNSGYSGANYADSWIDVKGNGYQITGNSGSTTLLDAFQVHIALNGWGRDNVFRDNTVVGGVPGWEVWAPSDAWGTVVGCDSTGAAKGMTNYTCTP
jgi:hypothetical protein